ADAAERRDRRPRRRGRRARGGQARRRHDLALGPGRRRHRAAGPLEARHRHPRRRADRSRTCRGRVMAAVEQHDLDVAGTTMRCYEGGAGFPLVVVHGSGPGVDTISNFGRVLEPLADRYHVLAFDLVGFGRSGGKPEAPYFDMDVWCAQVDRAIEHLGAPKVGLVGHSLGGAIVLRSAAERKDVVSGVVVTGTMGVPPSALSAGGPRWLFPASP